MKKLVFSVFLFMLVQNVHSQYTLIPAFPNLGVFASPTEFVNSHDGTNRLFLVQEFGIIYVFNNNPTVSTKKVFLDLSDKVATFVQTGILGLTFHPNYINNHYFYVHYIYENAAHTGYITRVSRFTASANNPDSAIKSSELIMLDVPVEYPGHYGGKILFGRDGYLYISFGDAGTGADGGELAQDLTSLRGKLLRIDVNIPSGGRNYSMPVSNPFYGNTQGIREEIYAYGFRNMWKFSYDSTLNMIFGADVGQNKYEEIDNVQKGMNYGWNKMEGFHCYNYPDTTVCDTTGLGFTRPIFEYSHSVGQCITGGYVYRGSQFPELFGQYIYGDFIQGKIWALSYPSLVNTLLLDSNIMMSSFGLDENKEIYVVSFSGTIFKLSKGIKTLNLTTFIEGFYNNSLNKMIRDTIRIYLRSTIQPYSLIDSAKSLLDSIGRGTFNFVNASNSVPYYIVFKHRNSLETWSSTGQSFTSNALTFDFSTSASQAFGNNMTQIDNSPMRFGIYSGDVNQDGVIDLSDITLVKNDDNNFVYGYLKTDVNGNNMADLLDIVFTYNNASNFVGKIIP